MIADLTGKIAIVTGGAQGIGAGICSVIDQQGATVVVADQNEDAAMSTFKQLSNKQSSHLGVDVTDVTDFGFNLVILWIPFDVTKPPIAFKNIIVSCDSLCHQFLLAWREGLFELSPIDNVLCHLGTNALDAQQPTD